MALNNVVLENEKIDSEENFEALLENFTQRSEENATREGKIVNIEGSEVFIDICEKSEGVMNINEIKDENDNLKYNIGDTLKVVVVGRSHDRPRVSHIKALSKEKVTAFIEKYDENTQNIQNVKIISKNKGGFVCMNKDGVEFFLPKTQSGFKDTNKVVGKTFNAAVIKLNKDENNIVISRKKILETERKKRKELVLNILENKDIINGVIKKITTYGMFVDVGGIDGLVHYSEISYKGPVNPSSIYKEGDEVCVKVINYDNDKKHLSLSIKATLPDPWNEIKDGLEVGDIIKVVVSNIESYGAFVDLGNDIEGFLHISEISWDKNIKNPRDFIKEGDELEVEVIEISIDDRRLRVSLKNLLPKPFDNFKSSYKEGDVVKGTVSGITNFGAFVKIGQIEGLLHNEDISWEKNVKSKDVLKIGDEIEVKIIKIDNNEQKISLSLKELKPNPTNEYAKDHKVGQIVTGVIKDIKDFGVFVNLDNGVEGLIKKEELDDRELKVGEEIEATISIIDEKKNRVRLSIKKLHKQKERNAINEINSSDKDDSLGDIIKEKLSTIKK